MRRPTRHLVSVVSLFLAVVTLTAQRPLVYPAAEREGIDKPECVGWSPADEWVEW